MKRIAAGLLASWIFFSGAGTLLANTPGAKPKPKTETASGETARTTKTVIQPDARRDGERFGDPDYLGDPVSLDITGIKINELFEYFSKVYGLQFIFDKSVKASDYLITMAVEKKPWNRVAEAVLVSQGLSYRRIGGFVHIITDDALTAREKVLREQKRAELLNAPRETAYFRLRNASVVGGGGTDSGPTGSTGGGATGGSAAGSTASGSTPGGAGTTATGVVAIIRDNLTEAGSVSIDPRTNTLIVRDVQSGIKQAQEIIEHLDQAEPQVEIEARIVIANRNWTRDLGVLLNTGFNTGQGTAGGLGTAPNPGARPVNPGFVGPAPSGTLGGAANTVFNLFSPLGTSFLSASLTANEQNGIVRTISAPRLIVQNNKRGQVVQGQLVPYIFATGLGATAVTTTTFQNANLGLSVTPQVAGDSILLKLSVNNDSVDRSLGANVQAPINQQNLQTEVLCENGGSLLLSGVITEDEFNNYVKTPGLSKIPILKYLFQRNSKNRRQAELLFFITCRIVPSTSFGEIISRPEGISVPNTPESVTPKLPSADMPKQSNPSRDVPRVVPVVPTVPNTKIKPEPSKKGENPVPPSSAPSPVGGVRREGETDVSRKRGEK